MTLTNEFYRPSLSIRLIRHAESYNNQVYREARQLPASANRQAYVDSNRLADPGLSDLGHQQAELLGEYLRPTQILTSPMKRTLTTIRPILKNHPTCPVLVHGLYFESEGCHLKDQPMEGMKPSEIKEYLQHDNVDFTGFPDMNRGWYCNEKGPETRESSEGRATRFYMWFCNYLDEQLALMDHDKEKTANALIACVGHGDFMSLVLKRIVASYGHATERTGTTHRSSFVHSNTAMTHLEYFGYGRFLVLQQNVVPHIPDAKLWSGGTLKDGWSYLIPDVAETTVAVILNEEEMEPYIREQTQALEALYSVEKAAADIPIQFIVRRGHQVVGVATFCQNAKTIAKIAVPPGRETVQKLLQIAIQEHVGTETSVEFP